MQQPPPERLLSATLAISVPLHLTARPPLEAGDGRPPILIGLHGYAMKGEEMMAFLERLAPPDHLVVSLEGPHSTLIPAADGTPTPKSAFHWGVTPRVDEVRSGHRAAVEAAIRWAVETGGDPERVSLAGFSQPTSHNYRLAMNPPGGRPFRCVVGLCGGLPGEWMDGAPDAPTEASKQTAVFHASTRSDQFYPMERIALFPPRLEARFRAVTFRVYDGGHRIPSAALDEARAFLAGAPAPAS